MPNATRKNCSSKHPLLRLLIGGCWLLCSAVSNANELSLMSWNVYFDDKMGEQRHAGIVATIFEAAPDIVCLQEVSPRLLSLLKRNKPRHYGVLGRIEHSKYGNVLLLNTRRLDYVKQTTLSLPSKLKREAQLVSLQKAQLQFTVANLHLESTRSDKNLRQQQLLNTTDHLGNQAAILCGDMNFGDEDPDANVIPASYRDVAAKSKISTFDVDLNPLARKNRDWFEPSRRLDRFYVQGPFRISGYQVDINTFSDHFPIRVRLTLNPSN